MQHPAPVLTRAQLLREGTLIDVSTLAAQVGFSVPIDVSVTLYEDYLAHEGADIPTERNILDTLEVLQDHVERNPMNGRIHFTMFYPIAGSFEMVPIIATLSDHGEGLSGTLYEASDLADD
jgi:hypothetical protein